MATSSNRPYQGYPYVDPPVTDVPSISADDAARWRNLPRRQLELNVRKTPTDEEVIDFQPRSSNSSFKKDLDTPVVYIDPPDADGSDVARNRATPDEETFSSHETIFYDPFENRRIDRAKSDVSDDSEVSSNDRQQSPRRPNHLYLNGAGPSAGSSTPYPSTSSIPSFMEKETEIYGRRDGDFPASPIPVSQFPEPPPAYAEIDAVASPTETEEAQPEPRPASPPKTQVILPTVNTFPTSIELLNSDRKYLNCQHCGSTVHSLVIQENASMTHATACFCLLIGCIPAIIFIYCTDYLKAKNHYCPNCNKVIGYQQPLGSDRVVYFNDS